MSEESWMNGFGIQVTKVVLNCLLNRHVEEGRRWRR